MKISDPRSSLIAGLALALSLTVSPSTFGAGTTTSGKSRVAQIPPDLGPMPMPNAPTPGVPVLSPSPGIPVQSGPSPLHPQPYQNPQAPSSNAPSVMSVPTTLGSQPALSPVDRPPLGMHFGERELLDNKYGVGPRPLPMGQTPYSVVPTQPSFQPSYQPSYQPAPQPSYQPSYDQGVPVDSMPPVVSAPGYDMGSSQEMFPQYSESDRFGYAPPPGTLGQTYKRKSRRLEETKHPRVGVVEVRLPENVDVSATGLKSKWTGKVWRLESDPLLPGIPHIYEIKASWGEGTDPQVRTVRLIMGRIVDLDF